MLRSYNNNSNEELERNKMRENSLHKHISHLKEKIQSQWLELEKKQKIAKSLLKRIKILESTSIYQNPDSNLSSEDEKLPHVDEPLTGHHSTSSQARDLEKTLSSLTTEVITMNQLVSNLIDHIYFLENYTTVHHDNVETQSTSAIKTKKNSADNDAQTTTFDDDDTQSKSSIKGGDIIGMVITVEKKRSSFYRSRKNTILLEAISEAIDETNSSLEVTSLMNPMIDNNDFPHSSNKSKTLFVGENGNGFSAGLKTSICPPDLDIQLQSGFSCLHYFLMIR